MVRRSPAVALAIFLIFMCSRAFGDVGYYKGDLEILETSGASCPQNEKLILPVELVMTIEEATGAISGYARATGGTVGRFNGSSPDRLALSFPYFNNPNAEGHTLGFVLNGNRITGELHSKQMEASAQDCNIDRGKMQLERIAAGVEAEKYLYALSVTFDAAMLESEAGYYANAGRYEDAERPLRKVIEMREAMPGKDDPNIVVNLYNLAQLYVTVGRYAEAEHLYKKIHCPCMVWPRMGLGIR
jgi:tetratricopeptide (TPR) repeat protein